MSPFYLARFVRRFPISLLAFERLHALLLGQIPPEEAVLAVLRECCSIAKPTDEDIRYFLDRADQVSREFEQAKAQQDSKPPKKTNTFGAAYREFVSGLESYELLLLACGFDYQRAQCFFSEVDRDDALATIKLYTAQAAEDRMTAFEAVVFGNGGGYSGSSGGPSGTSDAQEHDLRDAGFDELRAAFSAPH